MLTVVALLVGLGVGAVLSGGRTASARCVERWVVDTSVTVSDELGTARLQGSPDEARSS